VTGPVTLDVQNLPLDQMMRALLEAHDYTWAQEDGLIRVRSTETRTFTVDYLRMTRKGRGGSSVTLSGTGMGAGTSGGFGEVEAASVTGVLGVPARWGVERVVGRARL